MQLQDQNILFFTRTMALGGTENIILQLCDVFKPLVNKIVVCSSGGVNETALLEKNIKHYTVPDPEHKSAGNIRQICKTLKRIIKDEEITVIHTHHRMAAFYCQLIGMPKGIIYINTSHTAFYDKKFLSHIAFHNFNMIACGVGVKNSLVRGLGFEENRVKVICNGIKIDNSDNQELIPEVQVARENGAVVFCAIGRLSKEKGVEYLIKAVPLVKNTNILCVIVGSGPDENELKKSAEELGLSDKVVFLGYRKDVLNILFQVDFLVQPSLQEGLPLTPIEAFSQGKPVIGTNIDGTSEIVSDGENGYLVPPANIDALAESIEHMCGIDRHPLEECALQTYKNKYSYDVFSEEYVKFYKEI